MRINLDHFSVETPEGFRDETAYMFKNLRFPERLNVSLGPLPSEVTSLDGLLDVRERGIKAIAGTEAKITPRSDGRLDGLVARLVAYTFEEHGQNYIDRWAVALISPEEYVQVSYLCQAGDATGAERFQHILASVVPAKQTAPAVAPPGYVRRWAGRLTLDVPITLPPPPSNTFAKIDHSAQVSLASFDPKNPTTPLPSISEEIAGDVQAGTVLGEQKEQTINTRTANAALTSYALTTRQETGPSTEAVCRSHITMRNGIIVHISARMTNGSPEETASLVEKMAQSLEPLS